MVHGECVIGSQGCRRELMQRNIVTWSGIDGYMHGISFDDLLLYGQKAIFRKIIISTQNKFNRNEVVLMMLSNNFFKNSTPSIFALPHSKLTKTLNFHASYLCLHPHDRPLVLDMASSCCPASTYIKSSMSQWLHRVHSCLVGTNI